MRLLITLSAATMLALVVLAGCNSNDKGGGNSNAATTRTANPAAPQTAQTQPSDGARRITTVELNEALSKGAAIVVDVRNDAAFKVGHIKGAILIPSGEVANHLSELPRDKMIVTYCSWPAEHTSAGAVLTLKQHGIENAAALLGGMQAWQNAGLPVETGQ